ncbi:MAG: rhodanese-like domain-containing protein [Acidimicrobiia bacterium]|nr:rhodanese-like domain-containing protein [Acidimicrobiia bacterium]NNC74590.1 rhodanese-like domain-containing protein [Acidimicrobiia bacterium]
MTLVSPIPSVDPTEARSRIDEGALLVDIREQNEWDRVRIPGAELKPMSTVQEWFQDLPRDRDIVLQCQTGNRSGSLTEALMHQAGFDNVYNLTGGIVAWARAGFDIESG